MATLKEKILAKISQPTLMALATITEDSKPWVRYVTPMADENLTLWMATFIGSRKVAQIRKKPEVHLTVGVTTMETAESYLQIQGRAEILTDEKTKKLSGSTSSRIYSQARMIPITLCARSPLTGSNITRWGP